jgi:hypothetical protein
MHWLNAPTPWRRCLSKPTEPLSSDELRLLADIGFFGAGLGGLRPAALQLFEGLASLRPLRDFGHVGVATVHLNNGHAMQAVQHLAKARAVADTHPNAQDADRAMLGVFHALALHCAHHNAESQKVLQDSLLIPGNPDATRLAQRMLGLPLTQPQALETV